MSFKDGYFSIVDRKKDMIIASGYNVYPRDVEEVLYEHPAVLECCVAGVADQYRGETVKAYIVKRPEGRKGFVALPKRWVVERTFAWLGRCRRLSKDYEALPETSEAEGRFAFKTIRPVAYSGRVPHLHLKVRTPTGRALTTQVYIAGDPTAGDPVLAWTSKGAREQLTMAVLPAPGREQGALAGTFDIVMPPALRGRAIFRQAAADDSRTAARRASGCSPTLANGRQAAKTTAPAAMTVAMSRSNPVRSQAILTWGVMPRRG